MKRFKILSYEEEACLSVSERKEYYLQLREYLKKNKLYLPDAILNKIREKINEKIVRDILASKMNYELTITGLENIPNRSVIYASTHQDYFDHFNIVSSIPNHAIILNTNTVPFSFKLLMSANGIVYVNRKSAKSRFKSKLKLMKHVAKGKSIVVFPEGTYNCSPNKLLLPLHMGTIDMARKTGAPIVPVVMEYTYYPDVDDYKKIVKSCHVHFCKPIYVKEEDSLEEKLEKLREVLATTRYFLMKEKGYFHRKNISMMEYRNFLKTRLDTWRSINVDYNEEKKSIYGYGAEKYLFTHINAVPINDNGEFPKDYTSKKLVL